MNTLKKIYCRTFQAGFRLAMPFMPYREPGILNSVAEVEPLLKKLGVKFLHLEAERTTVFRFREISETMDFCEVVCDCSLDNAINEIRKVNSEVNEESGSSKMATPIVSK